jgi:hypothetical protein
VAALLNALTDGVDSGLTPDQVKMIVKTAIDSGERSEMIAAKNLLAGYNEQECPLN